MIDNSRLQKCMERGQCTKTQYPYNNTTELPNNPIIPLPTEWDGITCDDSWYNEEESEFIIYIAQQLCGFSKMVDEGNTFENIIKCHKHYCCTRKCYYRVTQCSKSA